MTSAASPRWKRIVFKPSGEALAGDSGQGLDAATLDATAQEIIAVREMDVDVCVVVGGGNFWRGRTGAMSGMDATQSDHIGMLGTVMNGLALQDALERAGQDTRVQSAIEMPRLCDLDPLTGTVIRASKTTAVRYERARPGELVHMDVKKIGRIPDGGGWRAHGRAATSPVRDRRRGPGYDYVHALVDDHSRLAYAEVHPDERADTCALFFGHAVDYFAAHGIERIERVMTDNAFSYRHGKALAAVIADIGARHKFIKPHCPWQNGKVERLNRTLQVEWAYRQVFTSNDERSAALAPWIDYYNHRRRHSALAGLPPISLLSPT